MPNFNPNEERSLMNLLAAMRGGLPGSQGYAILGDLLNQNQARVAQKQANLQGLIDMISTGAQQGWTENQAQSYAQAINGPNVAPKVDQAIGALYPGMQGSPVGAPSGNSMGTAIGAVGNALGTAAFNADPTSVMYQPDPMADLAYQQAQVDLQNSMAPETQAPDDSQVLGGIISAMRNALQTPGNTPQSVMAEFLGDPSVSGVVADNLATIASVLPALQPLVQARTTGSGFNYNPNAVG